MTPITDLNQLDRTKLYSYADYLMWQFTETVELFKGYIFPMAVRASGIRKYRIS